MEGYPAVPTKGELPAAFAWTGVPKLFQAAGYEEAPHQASRPTYMKRRPAQLLEMGDTHAG